MSCVGLDEPRASDDRLQGAPPGAVGGRRRVHRRHAQNIDRLVLALTPYHPYLRGAPAGLSFRWDAPTIQSGLNFTLTTDLGDLDLLGEITGGGGYESHQPHSLAIRVFGVECR